MPAFNRAYLSLYFFMFFLVSGSELLPKDPKPTSPAGVTVPTGLPDDLYNRLRQTGQLNMHIRIRRRRIDGKTLPLTGARDSSFSVKVVEPPIDPTEHWTLYLGTAFTYDALMPERFAIVPPPTTRTDPNHPEQWDRAGLGMIHFSSMQQKTEIFEELHDALPKLVIHDGKPNNLFYIDSIVSFFERLRDEKKIELDFNYILWYNILGPMYKGCGDAGGHVQPNLYYCNNGATIIDHHIIQVFALILMNNQGHLFPSPFQPVEMPKLPKSRHRLSAKRVKGAPATSKAVALAPRAVVRMY
ncbi:hypothetical protein F5880DRAFT_1618685 [Lentinula raphanica]|nr:hypothetical protein F5880DRAFT_1618685 [Lentinula raphanica]